MTTPGGVPNLPQGALTIDNLASKTQDMTTPAMRSRAAERFPNIFNSSTGGNALNDLTPIGIITQIFAGFNSIVANADPADVEGPEDLPGLLLDFIESLPVVGELIGLLEAILGTYAGDDPVLLEVQAIFAPIRTLLQLITGLGTGFPTSEDVTAGWGQIPVIDTVQEIVNAFVQAVLDAIAIFPIVGPPIASLGAGLKNLANQAIDNAQATGTLGNKVASLENTVAQTLSKPIWNSAHDGDSSTDWGGLGTDATITPTGARGAFVRVSEAQEKFTATIVAYRATAVTGVYFDLYKLDPGAGAAARVYQSDNRVADVPSGTTTASYAQVVHTMSQGLPVAAGDYYGWQIRSVGGNVTVRARTDTNPALASRPQRMGLLRDPSTTPAPVSFTQTELDAAYSNVVPYIEFDKAPVIAPLMFVDYFDRATL